MKSSILSIFKDNKGEYWSHNFQFVIWNILLMIGFVAVVTCSCIAAMTDSPNTSAIITSLCANYMLISASASLAGQQPLLNFVKSLWIKAYSLTYHSLDLPHGKSGAFMLIEVKKLTCYKTIFLLRLYPIEPYIRAPHKIFTLKL